MISVDGHKMIREGEQIGSIDGDHVYDQDGREVGYFENEQVYNQKGEKLGQLQDDYFRLEEEEGRVELEKVKTEVSGGNISDLARAAVWILLGE